MLKLIYITNRPEVARIAEDAGVDLIFIDMEFIGKSSRQCGMDTVQNHHTIDDIRAVKSAINKAELLVRVNPIHEALPDYPSSQEEMDLAIEAGADILMLPFFKTVEEVQKFISFVNGRAKTCLLLETPEAADVLERFIDLPGIDMIHIGLNDMHLALRMKFMFQLLSDGSVDKWTGIIKKHKIPFGFGGLASLNGGLIPGRMILKEHYRLKSQMVILSRSFCNTNKMTDLDEIRSIFTEGIRDIRILERNLNAAPAESFLQNHKDVCDAVAKITLEKQLNIINQ